MNNQNITSAWNTLSELRNVIKEKVKAIMGWKADSPFYDRVYGRVTCSQAEQQAFLTAFKEARESLDDSIQFPVKSTVAE